ncbi:hypothetical protein [Helcococcus kunzii]|uniref:hypothetical protein n=1 Tax=Helcococcus kunzii TaxID=40091 RepID=UPI0024AE4D04|nr:hypothetical protein [Helcococcus kunzii]
MSEKKKYINKLTEYFFYKYIYSIFLENKYIANFAKYEIEKMESIYQSFLYDKAIENRFVYGYINPNISNEFNTIMAKEEYKDLENQISVLKTKSNSSSGVRNYIKKILDRGILSKISTIIENEDPYITGKQDTKTWNKFLNALEEGNFEKIFKIAKNCDNEFEEDYYFIDLVPRDINEKIYYYENKILELYQYFPFNEEKNMYSKKDINDKINEIKKETLKSKETLKRITNVYLYTDNNNGLES